MHYLLLIHHGSAPTPDDPRAWASLPEEEQEAISAGYQAVSQAAGVIAGRRMQAPEMATTVRVHDGKTVITDGPYAEMKEALGGYLFVEAGDLDAVIALAARIPAARLGGGVEIRPLG